MSGAAPEILATLEAERKVLENSFARRMRELHVDREEYARLCEALRQLARRWRGCDLVDREAAGALQALSMTARDMIPVLTRADPALRDELEDMGNTLGRLVRDCYEKGP